MKRRLPNTDIYLNTSDFNFVSTPTDTNITVGSRFIVTEDRDGNPKDQHIKGTLTVDNISIADTFFVDKVQPKDRTFVPLPSIVEELQLPNWQQYYDDYEGLLTRNGFDTDKADAILDTFKTGTPYIVQVGDSLTDRQYNCLIDLCEHYPISNPISNPLIGTHINQSSYDASLHTLIVSHESVNPTWLNPDDVLWVQGDIVKELSNHGTENIYLNNGVLIIHDKDYLNEEEEEDRFIVSINAQEDEIHIHQDYWIEFGGEIKISHLYASSFDDPGYDGATSLSTIGCYYDYDSNDGEWIPYYIGRRSCAFEYIGGKTIFLDKISSFSFNEDSSNTIEYTAYNDVLDHQVTAKVKDPDLVIPDTIFHIDSSFNILRSQSGRLNISPVIEAHRIDNISGQKDSISTPYDWTYTASSSDLEKTTKYTFELYRFYPDQENVDLGTSTNKWDTIYGNSIEATDIKAPMGSGVTNVLNIYNNTPEYHYSSTVESLFPVGGLAFVLVMFGKQTQYNPGVFVNKGVSPWPTEDIMDFREDTQQLTIYKPFYAYHFILHISFSFGDNISGGSDPQNEASINNASFKCLWSGSNLNLPAGIYKFISHPGGSDINFNYQTVSTSYDGKVEKDTSGKFYYFMGIIQRVQ